MNDLKTLTENLHKQPILLALTANVHGTAMGSLSIPHDKKDLTFTYVRDTENGFVGDEFLSTSPFGSFFIKLNGSHSSSGDLHSKLNGQHKVGYDYIIFSQNKELVSSKNFNKVTFRYPVFIEGIPVGKENPPSVSVYEHVKRCRKVTPDFKLDVRLVSEQKWQRFPRKNTVVYDKLDFIFEFKKPKDVNRIRSYLHELNNYLVMFMQSPIEPQEVILYINGGKESRLPKYGFLIEKNSLSKNSQSININSAISLSRQGNAFLKSLTNAIYFQDKFYIPLNLIRAYWVYKDKSVYLDNQVSVLLSAVEAVYELVSVPSERQQKRQVEYQEFISKIGELGVSSKMMKWLKAKELEYTERKPFSEKIKAVAEFAGEKISNNKAETLNRLRNDLMHGRLPEWDNYLSNYYEQRLSEEGDKVNLKWLSWVLSSAVLKVIERANKKLD